MKRRAGILGYGYMGTIRHDTLKRRDDCEVAWIFDGYDDGWREVVDDPSLDCIFVCLPNHLTCEAVCRALNLGKHVFAEKPPGVSVAEVRRMIGAEAKSGKTLKFGFNHRYHPAVLAAKARIDAGDLGELRWLRGRYGKPFEPHFEDGWRADRRMSGGGIFIDQGIHMLDLIRMFAGQLSDVQAFASASFSSDVEDDLVAIMRNDAGLLASLHSSHTQWQPLFSLELGLSNGSLSLQGLCSRSGRYGPEQLSWRGRGSVETQVETFDVDGSWARELDEFFESVRSGAPVGTGSTREALQLMMLVEAIYASAGWPRAVH